MGPSNFVTESHQNVVGKEDEDEDEDEDWKQCPLFMTKLPEKPEEHEGLAALQSILYDDMTADERAENYNQQGASFKPFLRLTFSL